MSDEAKAWASSYAPGVPPHLVSTLHAFANYADDLGRSTYPTHEIIAWHTRKDPRSVRRDVAQLVTLGLIRPGNQDVAGHLPADRRPVVYDLAMERTRGPRPDAAPSGKSAVDNREDTCVPPDVHVPPVPPTGRTPASPRSDRPDAHVPPVGNREDTYVPPVDQGNHPGNQDEPDTGGTPASLVVGEEKPSTTPPDPLNPFGLMPEEQALHHEVTTARPAWSPLTVAQVLADPAIRSRPDRALVRLAFLDAARTRGTFSPKRLLHDGCQSWARAERERFGDPADGEGRTAEPSAVAPRRVPWCGAAGCDPTTRTLVHPITFAPLAGINPCPDCHPYPNGRPKK